ncbi:MAG: ParB N-terminal domain-containing protein [Pirellulales bacterium]|nr:ParB N-terminal domain-containing protein [Pirellulales bacterium]
MKRNFEQGVQLIPTSQIRVLNPRSRSKTKFQEMVSNISRVGLKRPITVSCRIDENGQAYYATGCGEGRLKAFDSLGQTEIPALVIEATDEELLLISLTENLARRHSACVEQMWEILNMKERGQKPVEIATKVGLDVSYVRAILKLLKNGEERLVQAVVKRQMPLRLATYVALEDDENIQHALQEAYENKSLRGSQLLVVRRLISQRKTRGKAMRKGCARINGKPTSNDLVRVYQKEANRQRSVIVKAKLCETRLIFAISAIKELFTDEDFLTLLRAEALDVLPKYLAERLHGK